MNRKYTFIELCETYNKIEIPIIQRDYAQGRETDEVKRIRNNFIDGFLIPSLLENSNIELDFVYGSILTEVVDDLKFKTFIPLDGQQRLTTLFLLHYFIGINESRLNELKPSLIKFTYETRPSAHDFCQCLLDFDSIQDIKLIRSEIEDAVWFNEEWLDDPTVAGMLKILDTFASNDLLRTNVNGLTDKLINKENKLISFYFTDLEQFGLTESLYIRMNARGKMLTDFENFKSEFFKIIRYNSSLLEIVKDKIEYQWVDNLWEFKEKEVFVIDEPFMKYLHFVTEMLYYKTATYRSPIPYETDFLNFKVLNSVYSNEENLKFLIFALDYIKELNQIDFNLLWINDGIISIKNILADIIKGSNDIDRLIILYASLLYGNERFDQSNFEDYIRVIRNLIVNTKDNSRREWPRLIASIKTLLTKENINNLLSKSGNEINLQGFYVNQRNEELFKAKLKISLPESKKLINNIEDNIYFKGHIENIMKSPFINEEMKFASISLDAINYTSNDLLILQNIYKGYKEISINSFNNVWGNLIVSGLYNQTSESRLIYDDDYYEHPAILLLSKNYVLSNKSLEKYIHEIEKEFIINLDSNYEDFSQIRNVKEQLYIYYLINKHIYNKEYSSFFKNDYFNFGWLAKKSEYKTHFSNGIDGCRYFPNSNPIFQVYNQQFRYNLGLNKANTLDIEIVGGKKRNPFEHLIEWANS